MYSKNHTTETDTRSEAIRLYIAWASIIDLANTPLDVSVRLEGAYHIPYAFIIRKDFFSSVYLFCIVNAIIPGWSLGSLRRWKISDGKQLVVWLKR